MRKNTQKPIPTHTPKRTPAVLRTALSAACLCTAWAAHAADAAPAAAPAASAPAEAASAPTKGELQAARQFKMLDFNGDGYLSREEVALFPRLAKAFDDADTDHDNRVSFDEIRAFALSVRAARQREEQEKLEATPAAPGAPASSASSPKW